MGKAFPYPVCRGWSFAQCQPSVGGRSLEGLRDRTEAPSCSVQVIGTPYAGHFSRSQRWLS